MIDVRLKYQASIFVDAIDIKPEPDTIKLLIDVFRDMSLIPSTFQQISPPEPAPHTRLQFSSQDNEWAVRFATHRIDIERNPTDLKGSNLGDLLEFCSVVNDSFERLVTIFKKRANRIALITNFMLGEMTNKRLMSVYRKLFTPPKFYADNSPYEWDWRAVSKIPIKLQKLNEDINVITTVKRLRSQYGKGPEIIGGFDRIQLSYDINTSQDNREYRFALPQIKNFYQNAVGLHNEVCKELLEYINE